MTDEEKRMLAGKQREAVTKKWGAVEEEINRVPTLEDVAVVNHNGGSDRLVIPPSRW